MTTRDEIIAMALRSGASVGKWGDAVLSADSLQLFAKEIERQAYERAAEVCVSKEIPFDIEDWINWTKRDVSSETALALADAIRDLIEGDGK